MPSLPALTDRLPPSVATATVLVKPPPPAWSPSASMSMEPPLVVSEPIRDTPSAPRSTMLPLSVRRTPMLSSRPLEAIVPLPGGV